MEGLTLESQNNFDNHIALLKKHPQDFKTLRDFLKFARQTKLRVSPLVVEHGSNLLKKYFSKLEPIEAWDVHEQVFLAALDTYDLDLSKEILDKIVKQFGAKSIRVRRLTGLQYEAQGKIKMADEVYRGILEEDQTNTLVMKRQIAIRKGLGDVPAAIKLLNEYLKLFMADTDAWHELSELYISQQMYKNAAFCYEELILAYPQNHHFFNRYAEILFTLGDFDNLKLSRKNFAYSYELIPSPSNTRALFGIVASCLAVLSTKQGKQDKESTELLEWAKNKLSQNYQNANGADKVALLTVLPPFTGTSIKSLHPII
eukprot:TRINITY_DN3183_c0_g1_i1.p1 TRINITY_DN3183_c0_g1~~TRINITY_DN3183_c0_g1_i1.p1  ORF type:complete len:315 (-),score=62.03 TRINITY_DN3183_c0_g1_i1:96-1040(-)